MVSSIINTKAAHDSGHTLIEVTIVIIVLGVMMSLAIPNLQGAIETSKAAEGLQALTTLLTAQRTYFVENQAYATNLSQLDVTPGALQHFGSVVIGTSATNVAQLTRNGNLYRLHVHPNGTVTCTNLSTNTICDSIGDF